MNRKIRKQDYTYISFCILYIILLIGYFLYENLLKDNVFIPGCWFFQNLGIYCPACGGTRAVLSFFHGDLIQSIYYNPIVFIFFLLTFSYLVIYTIGILLRNENLRIPFHKVNIYILSFVLIINWVLKNYMLFHFNIKI